MILQTWLQASFQYGLCLNVLQSKSEVQTNERKNKRYWNEFVVLVEIRQYHDLENTFAYKENIESFWG